MKISYHWPLCSSIPRERGHGPTEGPTSEEFKSFISSRERTWRYLSAPASPIGHPKFGPNEHALAGWAGDREKGEASRCGWQRRTGTIWRRRGSTSPCSPPSCVTSTSGSSRVQTGPTAQLSLLHSHDSCASNTRAVIVWSLSLRYAGGRRRGSTLALLVADGTSSTDGVCVPAFFTLLSLSPPNFTTPAARCVDENYSQYCHRDSPLPPQLGAATPVLTGGAWHFAAPNRQVAAGEAAEAACPARCAEGGVCAMPLADAVVPLARCDCGPYRWGPDCSLPVLTHRRFSATPHAIGFSRRYTYSHAMQVHPQRLAAMEMRTAAVRSRGREEGEGCVGNRQEWSARGPGGTGPVRRVAQSPALPLPRRLQWARQVHRDRGVAAVKESFRRRGGGLFRITSP